MSTALEWCVPQPTNRRPPLSTDTLPAHVQSISLRLITHREALQFSRAFQLRLADTRLPLNSSFRTTSNANTMPRPYKCKKCGISHPPPTGKHCRQAPPTDNGEDTQSQILAAIAELQRQMGEMNSRNRADTESAAPHRLGEQELSSEEEEDLSEAGGAQGGEVETATPGSLRKNIQLMAQAAGRIARLGEDDGEDEDTTDLSQNKTRGKKSGSLMVASDKVKRAIDWPHMHVSRRVNGKRKDLAYSELKVEEFAYGFLKMLKSSTNKMDSEVMMPLLTNLLQDKIDYSWANARDFYETIGKEVEKGALEWTDTDTMRDYRMTYSRAVFPEKKEAKEGVKTQPRQAPPGAKCCAAFQKHTCDLNRDHMPYSHVCAYCLKSCSLMCRHAEDDCIRKQTDESKNGKKREA